MSDIKRKVVCSRFAVSGLFPLTCQIFARKITRPVDTYMDADVETEISTITNLSIRIPHSGKYIVVALRHGKLPGSPFYYIDMELCDLTLEDYIYRTEKWRCIDRQVSPFFQLGSSEAAPMLDTWCIMTEITSAASVGFMHKENQVHRDLKPTNSIPVSRCPNHNSTLLLPRSTVEAYGFRLHCRRVVQTGAVVRGGARHGQLSRAGAI
jgi:hypothetical protein